MLLKLLEIKREIFLYVGKVGYVFSVKEVMRNEDTFLLRKKKIILFWSETGYFRMGNRINNKSDRELRGERQNITLYNQVV